MSSIDFNGHKRCSDCEKLYENPFESFSANSNSKDGLQNVCKTCAKERRDDHKDERREYDRTHYSPAKRDAKLIYNREHRDEIRERERQYDKANPQVHKAAWHRREALKLERDDGTVTSKMLRNMLEECGSVCMRPGCGAVEHLTIDHIVALEGPDKGWHTSTNIQILCRSCNSSKGTRTVDYRPRDWSWR